MNRFKLWPLVLEKSGWEDHNLKWVDHKLIWVDQKTPWQSANSTRAERLKIIYDIHLLPYELRQLSSLDNYGSTSIFMHVEECP